MQASEEQSWLTASLINGPICFITYCDFPFDVSRISKFATLILQAQVDIKALVWQYYIYMFYSGVICFSFSTIMKSGKFERAWWEL